MATQKRCYKRWGGTQRKKANGTKRPIKHGSRTECKKVGRELQIEVDFSEGRLKDRWGAAMEMPTQEREVGAWQHLMRESMRQANWDKVKGRAQQAFRKEPIDKRPQQQRTKSSTHTNKQRGDELPQGQPAALKAKSVTLKPNQKIANANGARHEKSKTCITCSESARHGRNIEAQKQRP